jgi:hypothetical protein
VVARAVARYRDWFVVPVDCRRRGGEHDDPSVVCGPDASRLTVSHDGERWAAGLSYAGLAPELAVTSLAEREGRLVAWAGRGDELWAWQTEPAAHVEDHERPAADAWAPLSLPSPPPRASSAAPPGYGAARLAAAGATVMIDRPALGHSVLSWSTGGSDWRRAVGEAPPPARATVERVRALAADDAAVVAVGDATTQPVDPATPLGRQARVWVSTGELLSWDEVIVDGDIEELRGVATDGDEFLAVGVKAGAPVVLVSRDGRSWRERRPGADLQTLVDAPGHLSDTTSPGAPRGDDERPFATTSTPASAPSATTGGAGGVAPFEGELPTAVVRFGEQYAVRTESGRVWGSPNGVAWRRLDFPTLEAPAGPDDRGSDGRGSDDRGSDGRGSDGRGSDGSIAPVAPPLCTGDGELVAWPYRWSGAGAASPAPGHESAGFIPADGAPSPTTVRSCAVGPDGYVLTDTDVHAPGPGARVAAVARNGERWLALGAHRPAGAGDDDPAAWTSSDGSTWESLEPADQLASGDGAGGLAAAVVWRGRLVLAGSQGDAALALVGPPPG